MAQWSKWLGHLPGLQEVQVQALSNPPFFTYVISCLKEKLIIY